MFPRKQNTCIHVTASSGQKITYCKFSICVLCIYCYLPQWKQNCSFQSISYKVLVKISTYYLCNITWCFLSYRHLLYSNCLSDIFYGICQKSQNDASSHYSHLHSMSKRLHQMKIQLSTLSSSGNIWSTLLHCKHWLVKDCLIKIGQVSCIIPVPTMPYSLPRLRVSYHYHCFYRCFSHSEENEHLYLYVYQTWEN